MSDARLTDCTDWAKVLVRAAPAGSVAARLDVPFGRTTRDRAGVLVVRTAPDAWTLLASDGPADAVVNHMEALADGEFASVVDVTHGYALVQLTGAKAEPVLASLCAIDLADTTTPDGTAFRSLVAGIIATVIRDDEVGEPAYLLQCDRSYGQYLVDVLTDAEFGPTVDAD